MVPTRTRGTLGMVLVWGCLASLLWGSESSLTRAEKALRLANLREAHRSEVSVSGVDSETSRRLRAEIQELERQPTIDSPATAEGGADPAPPATQPPSPQVSEIGELVRPSTYERTEGMNNPCGPYAVSAILQSFGRPNEFAEVYARVTPAGGTIGAGSHELISYLEGRGHAAVERNHGSLDDLAAGIDRGERMLLTVNTRDPPSLMGSHWIAVKGYKIVDGRRYWTFVDAYWSEGGAFEPGGAYHPHGMPEEELARRWGDPLGGLVGAGAGLSNHSITIGEDPPGLFGQARTAAYGLNDTTSGAVLTSGLRDVTRGFEAAFGSGRSAGDRVGGFFGMVGGGTFKLLFNIVPTLASGIGHVARDAGSGLMGWGRERWENGGLFDKAAGAGATILGAVCSGAGWLLNGAGTLGSSILGVAGDVVGGIGRAAGGAIDGIGRAFGSLF